MMSGTLSLALAALILANGGVLSLAGDVLPWTLRRSIAQWQIGTLAIACGFAVGALGAMLSARPLSVATGLLFVTGLTCHYRSLRLFYGGHAARRDLLPLAAAFACSLWFWTMRPDTALALSIDALAGIWVMLGCVLTLTRQGRDSTPSHYVMIGLFCAGIAASATWIGMHLFAGDAMVRANGGRDGIALLAFTGFLPVVGATLFLLMCVGRLKHGLEHAASTDHLTNLSNRRLLSTQGAATFERARDQGAQLYVAILDIDRFKTVNDTYGHAIGDMVLVQVSRRMKECVRRSDFVARLGGEEFALIVEDSVLEDVRTTLERIRTMIERDRIAAGPAIVSVTISAGISALRPDDISFEDILQRADHALYRAKALGRNRIEFALDTAPVRHRAPADSRNGGAPAR